MYQQYRHTLDAKLAFHTSFWQLINISNHLPVQHNCDQIILWYLPTSPWMGISRCLYWQCRHTPDFKSIWLVRSDALSKDVFWLFRLYQHYKLIFIWSDLIMPKPATLTVHEAHKEYNSLIDQIRAKYELLDSGECGSVGTPAFNAECSELAHLMARMSKLCKHLNLPMPKELHRPPHFKHWSALNSKLFVCGRFS